MRKFVIRRSTISILSYCVLEALFLKGISHINWGDVEVIEVINILGSMVVAVLILKFILSIYIVVEGTSVAVNHTFTKDTFQLADILSVDTEAGNFMLKNGRKVKFNAYMISKKGISLLKTSVAGLQG